MKRKTTKEFIAHARKIHGNDFDYSLTEYKTSKLKIKIICNIHNICFEQYPSNHLKGCIGCIHCSNGGVQFDLKEFKRRSSIIHHNKYDYSLTNYINSQTKLDIICPIHGKFSQLANSHLQGKGCKKCSIKFLSDKKRKSCTSFIQEANIIHHHKYDYSIINYINNKIKINIICPLHGSFLQSPSLHLKGEECKTCSYIKRSKARTRSTKDFIENASIIHNYYYDYSLVNYINCKLKIKIICPKHGSWDQTPDSHLQGAGCPDCAIANFFSKMEKKWLKSLNIPNLIPQWKIYLSTTKRIIIVDGFDPITNTVYEFYGDYWHGNPKAFNKKDIHPVIRVPYGTLYKNTLKREKSLKKAGYKIISIWEYDWNILIKNK